MSIPGIFPETLDSRHRNAESLHNSSGQFWPSIQIDHHAEPEDSKPEHHEMKRYFLAAFFATLLTVNIWGPNPAQAQAPSVAINPSTTTEKSVEKSDDIRQQTFDII